MDPLAALAKVLGALMVELLRYVQGRQDLQDLVRKEIEAAGLKDANEALGWKAAAVADPSGGAIIRVRDGALQITIPGYGPHPPSSPGAPGVPTGHSGDSLPPAA